MCSSRFFFRQYHIVRGNIVLLWCGCNCRADHKFAQESVALKVGQPLPSSSLVEELSRQVFAAKEQSQLRELETALPWMQSSIGLCKEIKCCHICCYNLAKCFYNILNSIVNIKKTCCHFFHLVPPGVFTKNVF